MGDAHETTTHVSAKITPVSCECGAERMVFVRVIVGERKTIMLWCGQCELGVVEQFVLSRNSALAMMSDGNCVSVPFACWDRVS